MPKCASRLSVYPSANVHSYHMNFVSDTPRTHKPLHAAPRRTHDTKSVPNSADIDCRRHRGRRLSRSIGLALLTVIGCGATSHDQGTRDVLSYREIAVPSTARAKHESVIPRSEHHTIPSQTMDFIAAESESDTKDLLPDHDGVLAVSSIPVSPKGARAWGSQCPIEKASFTIATARFSRGPPP